jgi:hypothetical protein
VSKEINANAKEVDKEIKDASKSMS